MYLSDICSATIQKKDRCTSILLGHVVCVYRGKTFSCAFITTDILFSLCDILVDVFVIIPTYTT